MPNFNHPLVGRSVVYRDPYKDKPEQGVVTSVNEEANLVFVRYGLGSTSAATEADERLTFLDGSPVKVKASELTPFERKILEEVAGVRKPPSPWGAAVGAALEELEKSGYITRKFGGTLTGKGKLALEGD